MSPEYSMTSALPTQFGVQLPEWVVSELADVPDTPPTDEDRVRLVSCTHH